MDRTSQAFPIHKITPGHSVPPPYEIAPPKRQPRHPREKAAIAFFKKREWREVIQAAESALADSPLTELGWLALAEAYSHCGLHSLAVPAYEHLLSRPMLPAEQYAAIYSGVKRASRPDLALAACRQALRFYPDDDAACLAMATQMAALGYSAMCVASVLERAVYLVPDNPRYRVSLALQYCRLKDWPRAHKPLRRVPPSFLQLISCTFSASMLFRCCCFMGDERRAEKLKAAIRQLAAVSRSGGRP